MTPTFSKPGMDVPPEVRRKFARKITIGGVTLKVELLPSLWLKAWLWIHGEGDDYALVRYFKSRPTKAQLRQVAAAKRSKILDDSAVFRL